MIELAGLEAADAKIHRPAKFKLQAAIAAASQ
jgi:hypothetical protein